MPVVCWGALAKSANDTTTIPDYIVSQIEDHNIDPSAHGLSGYAIYDHRTQVVLDHLDYSVSSDKISANQIIGKHFVTDYNVGASVDGIEFDKNAISAWYQGARNVYIPRTGSPTFSGNVNAGYLTLTKFVLMSYFESLDGFYQDVGGGEANAHIGGAEMITSGSAYDPVIVAVQPSGAHYLNFAKNPLFQTLFAVESTTSQKVYLTVGEGSSATAKYFGFKIIHGVLSAINRNGSTETATQINGITLTNWNLFKAVMTSASKIEFYVNNVLVATHTTNLPTGTSSFIDYYYISATVASSRTIWPGNFLFVQDP